MSEQRNTESSSEEDPWIGTLLGDRYRIHQVLGTGGMGVAYLANDERMTRPVVVKRPHGALMLDKEFRRRFAKEISHLSRLDHPHVLKVLDTGLAPDGSPYAVFPFLPGGSLRDRLDRAPEPPSVAELRAWLPHVASALDYVHAAGFVHRDVKPGNVLFDSSGHAYLADFGLSKSMDHSETALTSTGTTPGSPEYMGPEVVTGQEPTARYDQYGLGVVVYEALAGKLPFEGKTAIEVLVAKRSTPARELGESRADLPPSVTGAVMKALDRDPARRHDTCTDLALCVDPESGLMPFLPRPDTRNIVLPALPSGMPAPRRVRARWAAGIAVALGLAACGGWWLGTRGAAGAGSAIPSGAGESASRPGAPGPAAAPRSAVSPRELTLEAPVNGQKVLPDELVLVRGRVAGAGPKDVLLVDGLPTPFRESGFFETSVRLGMEPATSIKVSLGPEGGAEPLAMVRTLDPQRPAPDEIPRWARISWAQLEAARRHDLPVAFQDDAGLRFVLVPEGEFLMGSPEDEPGRQAEVEQQHLVRLTRPRYVGVTELTNAQARIAGQRVTTSYFGFPVGLDHQPATGFERAAAIETATALGKRSSLPYRLLSEAEWEHAGRGGALGRRWWGEAMDGVEHRENLEDLTTKRFFPAWSQPWPHDDHIVATAPGGCFEPNAFSLHDVMGNLNEWVQDTMWPFAPDRAVDPVSAVPGSQYVCRSASWTSGWGEGVLRLAGRGWYTGDGKLVTGQSSTHVLGLRLAFDVPADHSILRPAIALECPFEGQRALRHETVLVRGRVRDLKTGEVVRVDGRVVEQGEDGFETTVVIGDETSQTVEIIVGPKEAVPRMRLTRTLEVLDPAAHEVPAWARVSWWQVEEAKRLRVPVAFENEVAMRFVLIPPGQFVEGSPTGELGRELDEVSRRVRLARGFYLGLTEVTNRQFRAYQPWTYKDIGAVPATLFESDDRPATSVRRSHADSFARWLSQKDGARTYRLPTEAEWEYAARAGCGGAHPWSTGEPPASHTNIADQAAASVFPDWGVHAGNDGFAATAPVGTFAPNPWGLHEVLGNVAEYVAGGYGPRDSRPAFDPVPPADGAEVMARGGGFASTMSETRLALRQHVPAESSDFSGGVRLLVELPEKR